MDIAVLDLANVLVAKIAASSSRQLMCIMCSWHDHGPLFSGRSSEHPIPPGMHLSRSLSLCLALGEFCRSTCSCWCSTTPVLPGSLVSVRPEPRNIRSSSPMCRLEPFAGGSKIRGLGGRTQFVAFIFPSNCARVRADTDVSLATVQI